MARSKSPEVLAHIAQLEAKVAELTAIVVKLTTKITTVQMILSERPA